MTPQIRPPLRASDVVVPTMRIALVAIAIFNMFVLILILSLLKGSSPMYSNLLFSPLVVDGYLDSITRRNLPSVAKPQTGYS